MCMKTSLCKGVFLHCNIPFVLTNRVGKIYLYFLGAFNKLRICSCLACVYQVMDARRKFGEHKNYVRVARGAAESNSSFLSALQTSQVHP